jgi:serine/threonine protein kinase/tetratricopeptide (TPR) repeat protein
VSPFDQNLETRTEEPIGAASVSLSFLAPAIEPDEIGRLAHYRVLKVLGQGGMGIVLRAEDTHLQRPVALKVIRPDVGQSQSNRQRFLREARAMAQVRSDHVVAVHQVGQAGDICYLAMELLEGEPLDCWLNRMGRPPLDEALRFGREIGLALAAAHARGLVHRDVKPANVWLEGPGRRVKLLDFGLALPLDANVHLTRPGMLVGTPMFMAPEQARGETLDGRADLFSLGCLLYIMVAGRLPFEGKTTVEVLAAVITETPPLVSELNPSIPAALVDLISRLLAKHPEGRPASADMVCAELQALAHSITSTRPPTLVQSIHTGGRSVSPEDLAWSGVQPLSKMPETPRPLATSETPQSWRHSREAERRQVTVLVGGSDLFESVEFLGLESEDQAQALWAFQQLCEKAIRHFDGTIVQCNEQALLASFGFPVAREDAAQCAARAGLNLLDDVNSLASQFRRAHNLELALWIGLHTGQAIVDVKNDKVSLVGDARNIAVRLKGLVAPGQLVCTEGTHRLFKGGFRCAELGKRTIAGMPRPVTLFRVESVAVAASQFDTKAPAALSPLVGRDHEISLLKDRWELALDGMGQVVFLVGEPGLGKSRLVHSLKQHILGQMAEGEVDAPVIEWRCSPHCQNTGLLPAVDFYERALGFRPEEPPQDRFDRLLRRLAHDDLARPESVPLWAALLSLPTPVRFPPLNLPPARQRDETFRLMLEWLHIRAARSPVLFVVEDLHWVDASTLEFLGMVQGEFEHDRILTLLTFRPEFKPPWTSASQQTTLALTRLNRRQVGDLMRKKTGGTVSDSVIEQVFDRVGGVPLFVEEFTAMVQESAAIKQSEKLDANAPTILGHAIPSTLQDLVVARLDRLAGGRELAQLAAVLGREFSHEVLAAVAKVSESALQSELAQLIQAEILYSKGRPPNCTYYFKHALLEDALYSALVKGKRQQLHRRIAEALESSFPQTTESRPELLAYHFTEAGLIEKAIDFWLKAGQRSRERSALNEAIGHLTAGLSLLGTLAETPERDHLELQFLTALGPTYIGARGYAAPEVGPVLLRASELCRRIGESRLLFGVMLGMWEWRIVRGDLRLCVELAEEGMALANNLSDPGVFMEALFMPGVTNYYRGQFADARGYFEKALADYDDRERTKFWITHTGHDAGVTHRCYRALVLWHLGYPDQALQVSREMCELARSIGHAFSLGHAVDFVVYLYLHCRIGTEVQALAEEEIKIGADQCFPLWHALGRLHKAAGMLLQKQPDEGLSLLQDGIRAFRATGAEVRLPAYLSMFGEANIQLARFADAHSALNEGLAIVEKNDDRTHEAELHRLTGELLQAESPDQMELSEASFRRAIEIARQQHSRAWELRATMSLAGLLQRQQRRDEARDALTVVYNTYTEGFDTPDLVDAKAMLQSLV